MLIRMPGRGVASQMRDGRKRLGHSEEAVGNGPTSLLRRPEGTGDYSLFPEVLDVRFESQGCW